MTFKYNDNGETRWLEFAPFLHQSKDFRFLYDKLNDADMKETLYAYFVPTMEELLNDRIIKQKISDLYDMSPRVSLKCKVYFNILKINYFFMRHRCSKPLKSYIFAI